MINSSGFGTTNWTLEQWNERSSVRISDLHILLEVGTASLATIVVGHWSENIELRAM
jgi:hypothetical protein